MTPSPEPPLPRIGPPGEPCHECATPLAEDQRYCLECGMRRGDGGPIDFGALAASSAGRPAPLGWRRLLVLPAPLALPLPVAATMLATLVLAGVLLGSLSSSSSAGVASGVDIVLSPTAPVAAPPAPPAPAPPPAIASPFVPTTADPLPEPAAATSTDTDTDTDTEDDGSQEPSDDADDTGSGDASPIKHVFVIMLGEQAQPSAFGPGSAAPHLSGELVKKGTLLSGLHTLPAGGLPTTIALLSGQQPNTQTQAGCPVYADVAPGTIGEDDQEAGTGCVYSAETATLANQLEQQGLNWRAYIEDQARGGPGVPAGCRHPAVGAADPWRTARPGDAYATARNPFVYFHAITDSDDCEENVADLGELDADLAKKADDVPSFSYIAPNLCHDGSAVACAVGAPAGPAAADAFLRTVVAKIQASKAYDESLIIVSFERAAVAATPAPQYGLAPAAAPGSGGQVGALLLSPFVAAGEKVDDRYDTYSLLAMIEAVFGLDELGLAGGEDVEQISPSIITSGDSAVSKE